MSRCVPALLVVLALLVAAPSAATATTPSHELPPTHHDAPPTPANNTTTRPSGHDSTHDGFGARLSGFMASNAADANSSLDETFWESSYEHARNHTQAAEDRTNSLSTRYDVLKARQRQLLSMRRNGTGHGESVAARLRVVNASIAALHDTVNHTARATQQHNATPAELDDLHQTMDEHDHRNSRHHRNGHGTERGDQNGHGNGHAYGHGQRDHRSGGDAGGARVDGSKSGSTASNQTEANTTTREETDGGNASSDDQTDDDVWPYQPDTATGAAHGPSAPDGAGNPGWRATGGRN